MDATPKTAEATEPNRQIKNTGRRLLPWFGVFAAAILLACAVVSWSGRSPAAEAAKSISLCAVVVASMALFAILIFQLQRLARDRQFALAAGATLGTLAFGTALGKFVEVVFRPGISQGVTEFLYSADFVVLVFVAIILASNLAPLIKTVGILGGAGMIFAVLLGLYSVSRLFWENETPWDRTECEAVVQMIESGKLIEEKEWPGTVLLPPQLWDKTGIQAVFITRLPAGQLYFFQTCYRHGGFRRGYVYSAVPYEKLYVQKDNAGNDSTMINVGMEEYPHELIIQPTRWAEWFHTPGSAEVTSIRERTGSPIVRAWSFPYPYGEWAVATWRRRSW